MNLKRIRVDPDGLIVQDQKGFINRIRLPEDRVSNLSQNPEAALRELSKSEAVLLPFFTEKGKLDARTDLFGEDVGFLNRPLRVYYGIEPRCNLQCSHCGPRDFRQGHCPVQPAMEDFLLRQFADAGVFQVQLTGGEIGIRGYDLLKTIERTVDLGLAVIVSTNGVWDCIDDKDDFIRNLASLGNVVQSKISIEGTAAFHDAVRGEGTYSAAVSTLAKLAQHGLNPRINTIIYRSSCNSRQLEHLVELAVRYDATMQAVPLRPVGRACNLRNEMPSRRDLLEYTRYATELRRRKGLRIKLNFDVFDPDRKTADDLIDYRSLYDLQSPFSCGASRVGVHVTHRGEVYPCGFVQEVPEFMAGRISPAESLVDIWTNSQVLNSVRQAEKPEECTRCDYYGEPCNGGCWVMAWVTTGKIEGMDPFCFVK